MLKVNRGHWSIEDSCHYILDWNYDEDRSRTGHGPENITRLRRFAPGLMKSKGVSSVAQTMRQLNRNTRLVFDYRRMTKNSCPTPRHLMPTAENEFALGTVLTGLAMAASGSSAVHSVVGSV